MDNLTIRCPSSVAVDSEPRRERRGCNSYVPSTLRSRTATEDGCAGSLLGR
jgi:hypothetical protein